MNLEEKPLNQRMNTNIDNSLMIASTDFPSEQVTSRAHRLISQSQQNLDLTVQSTSPQQYIPQGETVIQQYTMDLVASGRDDAEVVDSLEQYYSSLAHGFDDELMRV